MTIFKIHSDAPYASRAGEFYRRQRDTNSFAYTCTHDGCTAQFYTKSNFTAHLRQHTGECPYACDQCGYSAKQKSLLDKHRLKEHNISLPSTRETRYKERISLEPLYASRRVTTYTGKVPTHKRADLSRRVNFYKMTKNILALVNTGTITKKAFYADKGSGYISDKWCIYSLHQPLINFPIGNSKRLTMKIASFMNQIHNLHLLYPKKSVFATKFLALQEDNKKSLKSINISMILYNKNHPKRE